MTEDHAAELDAVVAELDRAGTSRST